MPWYGRRRWYRPRRRRRFRFRSRFRKTFRNRRYQRRRRVRKKHYRKRKLKKIIVREFQPQTTKKCKIKGLECAFLCNFQKIYFNYQLYEASIVPKHLPGGGGWSVKAFSLNYLYDAHQHCKNIWTKGNYNLPLVKYLGCRIRCYQSSTQDWVFRYQNFYPMVATVDSYCSAQPGLMLMNHHTKKIPSKITYKKKKPYITFRIKPPSLMQNKWYFQETFAPAQLLSISATAANLGYSLYAQNTQSPCITLYCLNTGFYQLHDWSNNKSRYLPYSTYPGYNFKGPKGTVKVEKSGDYPSSVALETGFFQPKVLQATEVTTDSGQKIHNNPVTISRYNPSADTGEGNAIWLVDTFATTGWTQPSPSNFQIVGVPLYIAFLGVRDYILRTTQDKGIFTHTMFVCKSKAIKLLTPHEQTVFPFLDYSFIDGKLPYNEQLTLQAKANWYPTADKQLETLNNFVTCGNYVPKYNNLPSSTWQLNYKYIFYFKWGGPKITDYTVQNPKDQGTYVIPDKLFKTIQVANPLKQAYKAMFREWDIRRGCLTKTAIKRMSENLRSDSSVQSDDSEPETKKKKVTAQVPAYNQEEEDIKSCFQSLFQEEAEPQTEDMHQLIQFHQQQQLKLKHNIIQLLTDLKQKQRHLQMQTGLL